MNIAKKKIEVAKTGDVIKSTYSHHGQFLVVKLVWKDCIDTECGVRIKHGNYRILNI